MSNLLTIYSPKGEKFEVTKLNFHDLKTHYGWSPTPPSASTAAVAAATVEPVKKSEEAPVVETTAEEPVTSEVTETAAAEVPEETPVDEKTALIEELKQRFDYDADKRLSVAKLKMKLAEFEEGAAA